MSICLLADGRLERVSGAAADGSALLRSAEGLLESARRELATNPEAAYVLAYDAARKAATALVAQQGLRSMSTGHHVTVETVVRAQFGGPFAAFGALRRRRAEIEYPQRPGDDIDPAEAIDAIAPAAQILEAAQRLLPQLDLYP
jgi:hypothetical protein